MPTLLLLRHGHAHGSATSDHDRPLTADGRAESAVAGRVVAAAGRPDRALVSSARRARETFDALDVEAALEAHVIHELYSARWRDVLDVLAVHGDGADRLLVIGHEPWCSGLVETLTGARVRMPTAAVAGITVGPSWDGIDPQWCSLDWFCPPRLTAALEPSITRDDGHGG